MVKKEDDQIWSKNGDYEEGKDGRRVRIEEHNWTYVDISANKQTNKQTSVKT